MQAAATAPAPTDSPSNARTRSVDDYLKAIYLLAEAGEQPSAGALARRLGVSTPSASAMLRKLCELGMVSHVRYGSVELLPPGRAIALEVVRHHRLIETYLARALDVPWDRVHDEAEVLEHVLSEELEDRIASKLGDPMFDPHGAPIPRRDGSLPEVTTRLLADLAPGESGVVCRVRNTAPEVLRYVTSLGVQIGSALTVSESAPFEGPVTLTNQLGVTHAISRELAREIDVV